MFVTAELSSSAGSVRARPKSQLTRQTLKNSAASTAAVSYTHLDVYKRQDKAIERNIGARGLRAVMEGMLTQLMYDVPSDPTISKVVITRECVEGTGQPILTRDPHKVNYSVKLRCV